MCKMAEHENERYCFMILVTIIKLEQSSAVREMLKMLEECMVLFWCKVTALETPGEVKAVVEI